jgi:hypothetical protein
MHTTGENSRRSSKNEGEKKYLESLKTHDMLVEISDIHIIGEKNGNRKKIEKH